MGGGTKAIVAIADEPLDALSRLPLGHANKANSNFVIRVMKRSNDTDGHAALDKRDEFTQIGYLYLADKKVDNETTIKILALDASVQSLTPASAANYKYVWNIFTETQDVSTNGHKLIGFYNPSANLYLASCAGGESDHNANPFTSGDVRTTQTLSDDLLWHNYFTAHSYADHVVEEVIVKPNYALQTGETLKQTIEENGHVVEKVIERRADYWDHSKHFFHLQDSKYKIKVNSDNTISIVDETVNTGGVYNNNYATNGYKDEYVFEIINVMVASTTDVVYEFHATEEKSGATWNFELMGKASDNNHAYSVEEIKTHFEDSYVGLDGTTHHNTLRYYKDFHIDSKTGFNDDGTVKENVTYPRVVVSCKANFPFTISNDVNFDNAHADVSFLTLSVNADNDKEDGHYIGYEGGESLAAHGHEAEDKDKAKTDFRRHLYTGLIWNITKSHAEVDNPNSVRLHTFWQGLYMMQANIHGSQDSEGLYSFVPENMEQLASDDCDHEILQVLPNINTENEGDKGFTLVLKSNHDMVAQASSANNFGLGAKPSDLKACRMYANGANDLINILVNSKYTNNVGAMNFADEYDRYMYEYMSGAYLTARDWRKEHSGALFPADGGFTDGSFAYRVRLQSLHYSMLMATQYKNIDVNKKYRIELYHEGTNNTSNKMLSSFESFMKEGGNEIAKVTDEEDKVVLDGAGMKNAQVAKSALADNSAANASSYWQIIPTETGVTPENGEEVQVAFYNSNVGAYLKKTSDGVTLEKVGELTDDHKFYIKQEGTTDQWVILNTRSTDATNVKKLSVVRDSENKEVSPDAFDGETQKPVNTLYWSSKYSHDQTIEGYTYNDQHAAHHGRWMLTEIASYPLNISSVGWASLCLPYAVKFEKSSGVKVYYASGTREATDTDKKNPTEGQSNYNYSAMMKLTEVTSTDNDYMYIPANTPVLLSKTNGTGETPVNLEVIDSNVDVSSYTNISDNKFTAVNAQWGHYSLDSNNGGIGEKAYFGLSNKASHGVAFYPIVKKPAETAPYLMANKAFLTDANTQLPVSQLKALTFVFEEDDTVTEINTVTGTATTRPADGIYYDLSGRRVMNPKKGIYVNSNGKKFNVK